MKILIEKHVAEAALRRVVSVVEKRNTISILGNVMITAKDGQISLRVTNLDMEALDVAACEVTEDGAVTVEAIKLYDIIRGFPPGAEVKIETASDDPRLVVASGRSRFRLPMLPVADFPILELPDWPMTVTMPAKDLAAILAKSSYSAAVNDARYVMMATYIHASANALRSVACCSGRLAYADLAISVPEGFRILIPARTVDELRRRVDGQDGDVTLCASSSRMALISGVSIISSKLIDSDYMDYARVIPKGDGHVMRVDADALTSAVRGALLVAEGKVQTIRLTVSGGAVSISGRNANEDANAEIEADYDGPDVDLLMNGQHVLDMVSAFDADVLEATIVDGKTPTLWHKVGDDTCLALLSAMKAGA